MDSGSGPRPDVTSAPDCVPTAWPWEKLGFTAVLGLYPTHWTLVLARCRDASLGVAGNSLPRSPQLCLPGFHWMPGSRDPTGQVLGGGGRATVTFRTISSRLWLQRPLVAVLKSPRKPIQKVLTAAVTAPPGLREMSPAPLLSPVLGASARAVRGGGDGTEEVRFPLLQTSRPCPGRLRKSRPQCSRTAGHRINTPKSVASCTRITN